MLSKSEPKAYQKALSLIAELYDHPQTGTGKPEQLKGGGGMLWCRWLYMNEQIPSQYSPAEIRYPFPDDDEEEDLNNIITN